MGVALLILIIFALVGSVLFSLLVSSSADSKIKGKKSITLTSFLLSLFFFFIVIYKVFSCAFDNHC